ncbi:MAG: helicase-related protein, partial [Candidatus Pacebacteria bacterium]|nr:helicase-related protein [Candidatus Paceibacterota bacterium]
KKSDGLKFLVGFFYFSGIKELYEGLKENPNVKIKVLVGLNVDKNLIEFAESVEGLSDNERVYNLFDSLRKSLNTNDFDNEEFYNQVKYFVELIKNGKLVMRKTFNPNHSKVYIFKLEEDQVSRQKLFITGSSNLTKAGLTTQEEFNVEISDYGFEDAEKYFDTLWEEAVKITEDDVLKKKLVDLVEKDTLVKNITPFEAFVLVLKNYLDFYNNKKELGGSLIEILEKNGYKAYQYQLDAIKQGLAIIEKDNGVILADVVGLGKTIIACAIANQLKKRGVVICPPGLVGDKNRTSGWKKYLDQFKLFNLDWDVRSLGEMESIFEFVKKNKDIEVIIVDEAHRFRNEDTEDYESLKNICRDKIVILLSATPFNNKPNDILSLLKLFVATKKSSITLDNNLANKFKSFSGTFDRLAYIKKNWNSSNEQKKKTAQKYFKSFFAEAEEGKIDLVKVKQKSHYLAGQIKDVVEPVTIRRNRLDLQNNPFYKEEVKDLSKIKDPEEWFFELSKEQSDFYDRIISVYFGDEEEGGKFTGAIYRPFKYEAKIQKSEEEKLDRESNFKDLQQKNLYDFMRRLLVKRFESSFGSFEKSIKNFKEITEVVLKFISKTDKYILDRYLLEKIYDRDADEIEVGLIEFAEKLKNGNYPKNNHIYELGKNFNDKEGFIRDIKSDLSLYDDILKELSELKLIKSDPKAECLIKNLKENIKNKQEKGEPKRKAVIFSEYVDTVKYLEPMLRKEFGDKLLVVAGDLSPQKVSQISKNFDASSEDPENDYEVLLSSDKISEGFNLNRAGIVVNYDIPWNPVRVIQRVGRINRISKKVFSNLYIANFFPTEREAQLVRSREIAQNKMFLIHAVLGEDAKIFDIDEEPTPSGLYTRIQQNPDNLEEESFSTKALKRFEEIKKENPQLIQEIENYPPRVKVAKGFNENELFVFIKKSKLYVRSIKYNNENKDNEVCDATFEDVFNKVLCDKDEKQLQLSNAFWDNYEKARNFKEKFIPISAQSLEQKALDNLKIIISNPSEKLIPHLNFLRTLREDILDYGTLSDYTFRRIIDFKNADDKQTVLDIVDLKNKMGEDYLEKEKENKKDLSKEIIVAIENQKI